MTDSVPLVFDPQDNRIKELPVGDNLDLAGSGIVNAASLEVNGALTVNSITVNSQSLSAVAFSNNYEDLDNTPTGFTGDYNDLTNKPTIPGILKNLSDVSGDNPADGDALVYDALEGLYRPRSIINQTDLDALTLGSLDNVITVGNVTDRFLKFTAGAWRPAKVQYAEVENTPTDLSDFTDNTGLLFSGDYNDLSNLPNLFSGDYNDLSNLPISITDFGITDGDNGQVLTTDGAGNFAFQDAGDQIGNFTLSSSTIDTDDSSQIFITPALRLSSDLTVDNDVNVNGVVTASSFVSSGDGDPEFASETDISFSAVTRVTISSSPLKLATFTTLARDALDSEFGDMIYNSDVAKIQAYVGDAGTGSPGWVNLH